MEGNLLKPWFNTTTDVHKQICSECDDVEKAVIALAIEYPEANPLITQHVMLCKAHFAELVDELESIRCNL